MDGQSFCEQHALIKKTQWLNSRTVVLTAEAPDIASCAKPGQFVHVACQKLLRRPIGLMALHHPGLIQLGIQIQGEGTAWLAERRPGDTLSVLGPLGSGFTLDGFDRIITVGGGTGVFPLYFVQQICQERGIESFAVCGFRSRKESILRDEYEKLGCKTIFSSDAGDLDIPGHAAKALEILLEQLPVSPETAILTCGPRPMMQSVAKIAGQYGYPCEVSLEERMACGIGVCLVCACKVRSEQRPFDYKRCCVDGPVFPAEEVIW